MAENQRFPRFFYFFFYFALFRLILAYFSLFFGRFCTHFAHKNLANWVIISIFAPVNRYKLWQRNYLRQPKRY